MKKVISVLFLITISLAVWASDYNVLIYPSNTELSHYVEKWFTKVSSTVPAAANVSVRYNRSSVANAGEALTTALKTNNEESVKKAQEELKKAEETFIDDSVYNVRIVNYSGPATGEDATELDIKVLSYICRQANADILIIPGQEKIDDLYILSIDVWSEAFQKADRVYMEIRQNSELYSESSIQALAPYFLDQEQLASFTIKEEEVPSVTVPSFSLTSDVPAKVWVNETNVGSTPITLENTVVPSIVRLTADGYSDTSFYIDGKKTSEKVSMKPAWMDDADYYKESRKKFYTDFALVLGAFGLKVAVRSIDFKNQAFRVGAEYTSTGLIAVTLINLVYGLFNYYSAAGGMT